LSSPESFPPLNPSTIAKEGKSALSAHAKAWLHRWWPFILLLVVAASRWLVADVHPEAAPTLASAALGCGWAALLAFTLLNRQSPAASKPKALRSLLAGALFLGGPAIGLLINARELNAGALTIALALTPVAVAIAASAFGVAKSQGVAGRIWPGLAAVTGLLLILVQPDLGNTTSDIALFFAPTLTGFGAALFDSTDNPPAANALIGAAALFAFAALTTSLVGGHHPTFSLLAIAYEGVLALLSVLALSRLGATRWSSQFTWLPLLVLIEGIVLVRPPVSTRSVAGLLLLLLASIYLLVPQDDDPDAAPTLLR
jgi:drug/metabolite transporter (DMT)-like permease